MQKRHIAGQLLRLLALCLWTAPLWAQGYLVHSPPKEVYAGEPVTIVARVEGNLAPVYRALVFYRPAGGSSFFELQMEEDQDGYRAEIPAFGVTTAGVDYLIIIQFTDRSVLAFPEVDPYNVPMFLPARQRAPAIEERAPKRRRTEDGLPSNAVILSPEDGDVVAASEVIIAISLFNVPDVDLKSVRLEIDGQKVNRFDELSADLITYRPRSIRSGEHSILLRMKNASGQSYDELQWGFSVVKTIEQSSKVFTTNGNVTATTSSDEIRGISQNIQNLRANFNMTYDWLRIAGQAYMTSLEDPSRQRRNRINIGMLTPHLDLRIGDVNPSFSEFGLHGKQVRGAETDLKLRYVNLHLVVGELERAIEGFISETPDTMAESLSYRRYGYSYRRNVLALRPYFGSGRHFQLGLSLIKALDDTLSVARQIPGAPSGPNIDYALAGINKPQDNLIFGGDLTLAFDKRRLVWQNDFAVSFLNRDISEGAITLEQLDTYFPGDTLQDNTITMGGLSYSLDDFPIDPSELSRYFIINGNISPILPITPDTSGHIGINQIWNMPSTALRSAVLLNYLHNFVVLKYSRIGPEFHSLANPFMRNDVQNIHLSDKIRLFGNKLYITVGYQQLSDNLAQNKTATITTNSLYASILINPGEGVPSISFDTRHYSRFNDISGLDTSYFYDPLDATVVDSFAVRDRRENVLTIRQNVTVSHTVRLGQSRHFLSFRYGTSERSDQIKERPEDHRFNAISTQMMRFGLNSMFAIPLNINFDFSKNENESSLSDQPYEYLSMGLRAQYGFLRGNLESILGYRNTQASGSAEYQQNQIYGELRLKLWRLHRLSGRISYVHIDDKISQQIYNDLSFRASYSFIF